MAPELGFVQDAVQLPHPLHSDRVLRGWLARVLPGARQQALLPDLEALAEHALVAFDRRMHTPRREPVLTQWDAWGTRVDRITLTPAWEQGAEITTRFGLLAHGHDAEIGAHARLEQFLRVYLYHVPSEFYSCPLAMTDGAATALKASGNQALMRRALPHLLSREPTSLWLSGQWMTETTGGSDVSHSETTARNEDGQWRLYGRKWFTSAIVGEVALALARPEGSDALALFYVETKDASGAWNGLVIDRIKDKLGTRELPTAEIHLNGVPAWPVGALDNGVRQIVPMLNVTRTWNAVGAVASMARCIALARDYANRRVVFGRPLIEQPLHARTLANMQAEFEAAFALTFFVAELLGRVEHGSAAEHEPALLRLLTPLAKLWTGKLATQIASETLECFGGAGYIENTGIPQLLRDAQVYSIWEGTTNVLALDVMRALDTNGLAPLRNSIDALASAGDNEDVTKTIHAALDKVEAVLQSNLNDLAHLQANARGLAMTLARSMAASLLARHAAWAADHDSLASAAALRRFLAFGLDRIDSMDDADTELLLG